MYDFPAPPVANNANKLILAEKCVSLTQIKIMVILWMINTSNISYFSLG